MAFAKAEQGESTYAVRRRVAAAERGHRAKYETYSCHRKRTLCHWATETNGGGVLYLYLSKACCWCHVLRSDVFFNGVIFAVVGTPEVPLGLLYVESVSGPGPSFR